MRCANPLYLYKEKIWVGCGTCTLCRIKKSMDWSTRLLHELSTTNHDALFVTYTYNNEHILNYSLHKKHMQDYLKRLRKGLEPKRIKYFLCGEYGDQTQRPHYHAILFNVTHNPEDLSQIIGNWKYGITFVDDRIVTIEACAYVAGYIRKKLTGKLGEKYYEEQGREPPFQLQSYGLGKKYCLENRDQLSKNLSLTIHGFKKGLPRYYRKILGLGKEEYQDVIYEYEEELIEELEKYSVSWKESNPYSHTEYKYAENQGKIFHRREITPEYEAIMKSYRQQANLNKKKSIELKEGKI